MNTVKASHATVACKHVQPAYFFAMTVALARDVEDFLREQVRSGVCADAGELVNDLIRSLREQQRKSFDLTPELEAWLLAAADQPATPLTKADFDAIRERVGARAPLCC